MFFYQLIAGANVGGGHLLLRRKAVFDHLKYPVKSRQSKDQHHHAADARRLNKLLIAAGNILQVFAIAFRLRMLLAANRHIQFGGGFTRQNIAQPFNQRTGQRRVDHKIGAGEAKHDARFGMSRQTGINKQFALLAAMEWQQKRQGCHRRNQFTHQPGGFIAVKEFVRDLQVGAG